VKLLGKTVKNIQKLVKKHEKTAQKRRQKYDVMRAKKHDKNNNVRKNTSFYLEKGQTPKPVKKCKKL